MKQYRMDDHRAASVIERTVDDQSKTGSRTITIYAQTASSKGPCKLTPIFLTDWVGDWAETLFLAYESLRPDTLPMVHTRLQEQQVNSQCMDASLRRGQSVDHRNDCGQLSGCSLHIGSTVNRILQRVHRYCLNLVFGLL